MYHTNAYTTINHPMNYAILSAIRLTSLLEVYSSFVPFHSTSPNSQNEVLFSLYQTALTRFRVADQLISLPPLDYPMIELMQSQDSKIDISSYIS